MKNKNLRNVGLMFKWMEKNSIYFILSIILLFLITYLRSIVPLFSQHIIDSILKGKESELPAFILRLVNGDSVKEKLLLTALMLIAIETIRALFIFLRRTCTGIFSESLTYSLRNKLYKKYLTLSYDFHKKAETGDLIQRATSDIDTYRNFISDQVIEVIRLVFTISFSVYQMSRLNLTLMWISLASSPIIFLTAFIYFTKVKKLFEQVENDESKMTTDVQESISGIRVVKAFANEKYEVDKFEKLSRKYTNSSYKVTVLMALFWGITDGLIFIQYMVTACIGITFAVNGIIEIGMYSSILMYVGQIVWPMRNLGRIIGDFGKATVSVSRIDEILSKKDEFVLSGSEKPEITGNVSFNDVYFKFNDSNVNQIDGISFNVKRGETIAIVGKTGSGKSTLMNLLIRLMDLDNGEILLDNTDVRTIDKHYLRENIGIVSQEPFLFSKTIESNIGITLDDLNEERIINAAKIANVHNDIIGFEKGYKTIVGEKGVTLSGGQKQRVAIARTLVEQKPILIFDDSLSAVDTMTDVEIRKALNKYYQNSTVFIITHRILTAMEADRIIVLDNGKIVEEGTHQELLNKEGLYKTLYNIQSTIDFKIGDDE